MTQSDRTNLSLIGGCLIAAAVGFLAYVLFQRVEITAVIGGIAGGMLFLGALFLDPAPIMVVLVMVKDVAIEKLPSFGRRADPPPPATSGDGSTGAP